MALRGLCSLTTTLLYLEVTGNFCPPQIPGPLLDVKSLPFVINFCLDAPHLLHPNGAGVALWVSVSSCGAMSYLSGDLQVSLEASSRMLMSRMPIG